MGKIQNQFHTEKRYAWMFVLVLLVPAFSFFLHVALADDPSIEELLEDREDELDEIKAKIKAYNDIVALKQRQGAALGDQIESLEAQAKSLELQIGMNKKTLGEIESEIQTLTSRISQKEELIRSQKSILSEVMRGYYADQSYLMTNEFIVNASQITNPLQQQEWTAETGDKMSELLSSLKALRESLVNEHKTLIDKQKEADSLRIQLEDRNEYLDSTKTSKARLLAQTESEVKKYDALVDSLQAQREAIENEIEDLEAGKVGDLDGIPGYQRGLLAYPVETVRITQGYGKTSYSNHYASGRHNGIDLAAETRGKTGDKVMAADDGEVVGTGDMGRVAYGKWITIDHGNGLVTLYGHLNKISVSRGDDVDKEDKIGEMGSTGDSSGPHLHFTVYAAESYELVDSQSAPGKKIPIGASINPMLYLP